MCKGDPAVQALATGCPNLTFCMYRGAKGVKNEAVKTLGLGACASNLLDINIANIGEFSAGSHGCSDTWDVQDCDILTQATIVVS